MFQILLLAIFIASNINESYGLYCIACTSFNTACGATVTDFTKVAIEPCNGRCYIRTDAQGVTYRGCDIGLVYSATETIPSNGCATRNGESWCWCTNNDDCNYSRTSMQTNTSGTATSCAGLKCYNGGVCTQNTFSVSTYYCLCPSNYTGPDCSTRVV